MGSLLLCAGAKGQRFALPHSSVMVHQPSGGYSGQVTDIMIHAKNVEALKKRLNEIYVKHCGRTIQEVENALERDNFLTAEEAVKFGLIDKVLDKRPEPSDSK
jgi:ATP-dependent Clp protease, protease subunit